jgi:hypothetical protein
MRRLALPGLVALLLTPVASAQEVCTTYAVGGTDTQRGAFRGELTVRARADRRFDVGLSVTFASGGDRRSAGVASGTGRHVEGRFAGSPGLSGGLTGATAEDASFSATFDPQAASCQGTLLGSTVSWFWGARPTTDIAAPAYQAGAPQAKQAALWREVSAVPYGELPALGSHGVGETFWDTVQALRKKVLERAFSDTADVRVERTKLFHPFGSVAEVSYEPVAGTPYTGLYATGGAGLARLSLATDADAYVPGIALKLFVAGRPSLNVHAIPSFDPQSSADFFERAPSNQIPEPSAFAIKLFMKVAAKVANPLRRPVEHLARVQADGTAVASPVSPVRLFFRPADVHFPANSKRDFRDLLASVPVGTVIYHVYGVSAAGVEAHIGDVRTRSPFVASSYGDRVLSFDHER